MVGPLARSSSRSSPQLDCLGAPAPPAPVASQRAWNSPAVGALESPPALPPLSLAGPPQPPPSADALAAQLQAGLEALSLRLRSGGGGEAEAAALDELRSGLADLRRRAATEGPSRWGGNATWCDETGCQLLVARSWEELQHYLFLDSWDERIGKHRLRAVFRGQTNARDHRLQTSIQRLGDRSHIRVVEPAMIRAFRKYAVPEFSSHGTMREATVWEWLTVAQHHGLPTRLLDWTHNPMIAAHFVTEKPEDLGLDGAIWAVDPAELNARCAEFRAWNLARPQSAKVLGLFSIEQLEEYCRDVAPAKAKPGSRISSLDMFDDTQLRCAFLEPPSIDARLVHQQGLFSVLSPELDMDELLTANPRCARKILVPAWLKREVRDKLDAIGVSERTLFPGLDGLCTWLRRYYTKGARVEAQPGTRRASEESQGPELRHSVSVGGLPDAEAAALPQVVYTASKAGDGAWGD